ncbi:hypothetical protein AMS68_004990 [Peltaster fructicola]|uniref:Purine-cytosine permease FCY21 n=1 Tax=Peltaster fructicola TaxID=286661 RepID=A0A6H0XXJ2_9PEZI|nr:hypothetical protein AMS68_004990 [Peltaster fructicola]
MIVSKSKAEEDNVEHQSGSSIRRAFRALERTLIKYNIEARGIQRVLPEDRQPLNKRGLLQIYLLWFSINLAAVNITLGMLGPAVFSLSFRDASLCAVFGSMLGSLPVAYIATFGPRSGNRTMVLARYVMGWYPSKLVVILNIIVLLGYALINAVVAGQIISAVSVNGGLSIIVGIVVVAVITWVITTFGYSVFHLYERYAWFPQLVVLSVLAGIAGPNFDLYTDPLAGSDTGDIAAARLSFFSLCLSAAITYSGGASDYFVYYPERTPSTRIFFITMLGLTTSFTFAFIVGIGLASGIGSNDTWASAFDVSEGALVVAGFAQLGGFGSFCSVVVALGIIANLIPTTYSSGVDFQTLGRYLEKVPRVIWNTIGAIIYTVCAIAGRAYLAQIFTNFLALMGYWVSIWLAIFLEEHLIFRWSMGYGWNWDAWNDRSKLPLGLSALFAFLVGWAGAVLSMAQVWYVGPIAALVGEAGADMGNYVGFAWAALVYAPLRWLELKRFQR